MTKRYYSVSEKLGYEGIRAWRRMRIDDQDGIGEIDTDGFFFTDAGAKNQLVTEIKEEMLDD